MLISLHTEGTNTTNMASTTTYEFLPEIWERIKEYTIPNVDAPVEGDLLVHKMSRRVARLNMEDEDKQNLLQGATMVFTHSGEKKSDKALELEEKGTKDELLHHLIQMGKSIHVGGIDFKFGAVRACAWHTRNSNGETAYLLLCKHSRNNEWTLIDYLFFPYLPWLVELKFKDKYGKSAIDYAEECADGYGYEDYEEDTETADEYREYLDDLSKYDYLRTAQYVAQCERENVLGIMDNIAEEDYEEIVLQPNTINDVYNNYIKSK